MTSAMPLQGTFDVLDFTEVLKLLARHQMTGRLHLRSRSFGANLFFDEGALVGADQSEHPAAAAAGDVRGRLEEICFELLEAERGSFEFQPGRATTLPGTTRLKVETVLSRARKRLEDWRGLQERIPSLEVQPHLVSDLDVTEVTLDKERWRMLTTIDGRRNLRIIGRSLNLSEFDVCRVLASLLDAGVVELDGRAAVLAAAGRDVVPTIPLPDALASSVVQTPDDQTASHEAVKVRKRPQPATSDTPSAGAKGGGKPPTDQAKRSEPAGPTSSRPVPDAATSEERPSRRRARRRTPGGGSSATPRTEGPKSAAADEVTSAKRSRRVVRIRTRSAEDAGPSPE